MPSAGFGVFSLYELSSVGFMRGQQDIILFMENIEKRSWRIDTRLFCSEIQKRENHRNGDEKERYKCRN